jgi:transcriptional regulator with XRE-family HTH domain
MSPKHDQYYTSRVQLSPAELTYLWRARLDADISLKPMARLLGVTLTAFKKYESGERRVPEAVLSAWRKALDGMS